MRPECATPTAVGIFPVSPPEHLSPLFQTLFSAWRKLLHLPRLLPDFSLFKRAMSSSATLTQLLERLSRALWDCEQRLFREDAALVKLRVYLFMGS